MNSLPIVEIAYPLAKPVPDPTTPDYTGSQGYLNSAPGGIDAKYSWSASGGTGSGVKIVDIEYSWNLNHEDLSKARNALMEKYYWSPSDPFNDNNHGTAVLGELIADDNGFGVTGIAKGAAIGVVPCNILIWGYVLAESIQFAADNLVPGDVILIEQQIVGPNGGQTYVPVEWDQGVFDAIQYATAKGVVVIEPAGNGAQNLDDPVFQGKFNRNIRDSGAIVVGAGYHPGSIYGNDLSRASFSTFGSRVDLQGWGDWSVTTTGYGDLYSSGGDANTYYTFDFSGTSSASPIIAGGAADLESVFKSRNNGSPASPNWIRQRLVDTGTPQSGTDHIGPRPNLLQAETDTITVYSIDLQFIGQDPATRSDLHGSIYNSYQNQASLTTYSFTVPFNTQTSLSLSSNPSGWAFANWWDDYGVAQSYSVSLTINVGTSNLKVAAFFTPLVTTTQTQVTTSTSTYTSGTSTTAIAHSTITTTTTSISTSTVGQICYATTTTSTTNTIIAPTATTTTYATSTTTTSTSTRSTSSTTTTLVSTSTSMTTTTTSVTVCTQTFTSTSTSITGTTFTRPSTAISLLLNPNSLSLGSSLTLSGSIASNPGTVAVAISLSLDSGATWILLISLTTDNSGSYSTSWTPPYAGSYMLRSSWSGNNQLTGSSSSPSSLTVTGTTTPNPTLFLTSPATATRGQTVRLQITVFNPTSMPLNANVTIQVIGPGNYVTFDVIQVKVTANSESTGYYDWTVPDQLGVYNVTAGLLPTEPTAFDMITIRVS